MKNARILTVIGLVMLAAGLTGCDKSKEWCVEEYDLVANEQPIAVSTPPPDPGPRIILKKNESTGNLDWYFYNQTAGQFELQTAGGPANGKIRADFTGELLSNEFKFHYTGTPSGTILNSMRVDAEKTSVKIKMLRTIDDKLDWDLNGTLLTPDPTLNGNGKVPDEFMALDLSKLFETAYDKQGDWAKIIFKQ